MRHQDIYLPDPFFLRSTYFTTLLKRASHVKVMLVQPFCNDVDDWLKPTRKIRRIFQE